MNLDLDETQELLKNSVRDYLQRELPFDRIRELERAGAADATLWKGIAEQGWLELIFSEARGGAGASLVEVGIFVEELARRAAIVPILEVAAAGRTLERFAPAEVVDELVPGVLAGTAVPVPALLEATDREGEVALAVGADGRVSGEKTFVDYGQWATHHLVSARDGQGPGLFLVEAGTGAVRCEPLRSIGRTPLAAVRYSGALARRVGGADALAELVRTGRALAALQCVGSMGQALEMTVAYASVREQFGKPIGSFQAVRHHCANMAMRVASTRLLAYEALFAIEAGGDVDALVAAAKASASRAAPEVLMLAHQIHGGNGVIEENDLYFFTLRGKERSLAWGSGEECLELLSAGVEAPADFL